MKKILLTALLILGLSGLSMAATAVNTGKITPSYQKALGGLTTGSFCSGTNGGACLEAGYPAVITGVEIVSGATANIAGIYDYSANVPAGSGIYPQPTNAILELSTAANTATFYDFSQTPIRTVYGIETAQSQTTGGLIVYTVQYP